MKPYLVLFDIDHTLSDAAWRDGMIGDASLTWDDYHQASVKDRVIEEMAILQRAIGGDGIETIGVTARPEKYRQLTHKWLLQNNIMLDEILMRPDDNKMPSAELKPLLLQQRYGDNWPQRVLIVFEDNERVADAYVALGIPTLQFRGRIAR